MAQFIIPILITTAISLLAAYLMRPKTDNPIRDEKPSTIASRGAFIPVLLGRRRLGPVVGWVGRHTTKKEGGSGGKGSGGGSGDTKIHYEKGWHIICVGPAFALFRILESGKTIWEGPIYRSTTPSGSTIDVGKRGSFRIYWGEPDQPIDSVLSNSNNVEISSRWPYVCYVVWNSKRLGPSWVWPMLDYEIEVQPEFSTLQDSPAWIGDSTTLSDRTRKVYQIYGPGGPDGSNYIEVKNDRRKEFKAGSDLNLAGNVTNPDGDHTILSVVWKKAWTKQVTQIFVNATLTDDIRTELNIPSGTVAPYVNEGIDGANPAHMIDQLLYSSYPHGLGVSQDDFSKDSLEQFGVLMSEPNENFYGAFLVDQGEEALGAISGLMQDAGVLLRFNTKNGKFEFVPVRTPTVTPPHLDEDSLIPPLPEIETLHGTRTRTRLMFKFRDRTKNFRDATANRDDDSLASLRGHVKTISVAVPSVINYEVAAKVADRRSQEEFGNFATFKIRANREARALLPGDNLTVTGIADVLRILDVQLEPLSSNVTLGTAVDFYGVAASTFQDGTPGGDGPLLDASGLTPFLFIEVPAFLKTAANIDCIVPYLRPTDDVNSGITHFSRDNITYQNVNTNQGTQTGGLLTEAIDVDDPTYIEIGPQFEAYGVDIDNVEDLTGDDENWRLGRQLCCIGGEIFYLRKITAISGDIYRLDGLIRARYDTVKEAHPFDSYVFIFTQRDITWFDDILLSTPQKDLYIKVQPDGIDTIDLADIDPQQVVIRGKGVVPMDPRNLRTVNMSNTYKTGEDVPLKWAFMSAAFLNSAAGLQGSGEPHATPPIPGEFVLRFRTTGDVLQKEFNVLVPSYEVDNADLVTWFGSEPASFKVAVSMVQSGYESDENEITITRV